MRRPNRDLALSLLACCATFAHGWQRERELRSAGCDASACAPVVAVADPAAAHRPAQRATAAAALSSAPGVVDRTADAAERDALLRRARTTASSALSAGDVTALEARGAAGDADAAELLASLYADPRFAAADPERAFAWIARYAELGDAAAKLEAAYRTLWDAPEHRPEWRAQALGWLAAAAEAGSGDAALELLELYEGAGERFGIARDPERAERWYAALREHADSAVLRAAALRYQDRGDAEGTARAVELWTVQGDRGGEFGSNNAAWLLAVCGTAFADHERAWRLIQREHRDHGESWQSVDTLAAVQARLGMWGEALVTQQRALDLLATSDAAVAPDHESELRQRLAGYAAFEVASEPSLCPPPP